MSHHDRPGPRRHLARPRRTRCHRPTARQLPQSPARHSVPPRPGGSPARTIATATESPSRASTGAHRRRSGPVSLAHRRSTDDPSALGHHDRPLQDRDVLERIARDGHEVGEPPDRERADPVRPAHRLSGDDGRAPDRVERRHPAAGVPGELPRVQAVRVHAAIGAEHDAHAALDRAPEDVLGADLRLRHLAHGLGRPALGCRRARAPTRRRTGRR